MSILINNHNSKHSKLLLDTLKNELSSGTTISIKLGGFSMWPFIKPNTTAIIKKTDISNLKKGDIIIFSSINKLIAHRIIRIKNNSIITKGDNEFRNDGIINISRYMGKAITLCNANKTRNLDTSYYMILGVIIAWLSYIITPLYRITFKFKNIFNL